MGYPIEIFNQRMDENLCCSICREVLENPHSCQRGHCFCLDCITQYLNMSGGVGHCPNDRGDLSLQSLRPVLNIRGFIDNLSVRCSTGIAPEGNEMEQGPHCEWTGPLHQLHVHLRDQCQFQTVKCPLDGCNTEIIRQQLTAHQAQCPHRLVSCQHCQVRLQIANKEVHLRQECPLVNLLCPYFCGERLARQSINFHVAARCKRRMVQCEIQGCEEWCRAALLEKHMAEKGAEHTSLLRGLMLTRRKQKIPDTFIMTLRWAIPEFHSKIVQLGDLKGIKSRRFILKGKTFILYLYPKGFAMNQDGVGLFIDVLPNTGPLMIKSYRASLTKGTSTFTMSSTRPFVLNPPHTFPMGFQKFIDQQSLITWVDAEVLDICIHLQFHCI